MDGGVQQPRRHRVLRRADLVRLAGRRRLAWLIDERSATDLRFPMWIYYAALPAGGLLMLDPLHHQAASGLLHDGLARDDPRMHPGGHELPGID